MIRLNVCTLIASPFFSFGEEVVLFVCLVRRIRLNIGFQAFKIAIHVSLEDGHTRCLLCWD